MNVFSGYKEFTLASGQVVRAKFCNATTEIYARAMGFKTVLEVQNSLEVPMTPGLNGDEQPILVPEYTIAYMEAIRMYFYAACKYAALAQNLPVDFNEWVVSEWMDEIGQQAIFDAIEQPDQSVIDDAKKNRKKELIRPAQ